LAGKPYSALKKAADLSEKTIYGLYHPSDQLIIFGSSGTVTGIANDLEKIFSQRNQP
jgi:hypothetical protein